MSDFSNIRGTCPPVSPGSPRMLATEKNIFISETSWSIQVAGTKWDTTFMVVSQGICHETDLRLIWDGFDTVLIFVGERSKSGRTDVSWISAISHESRENRTFLRICVGFFSVEETSLMIHKTIIGDVSECSSLRDISATSDTTYTSIISTEEKNTIIIFNWECKLMFSFKTTELLMALDIK